VKQCKVCGVLKNEEEFGISNNKDGLNAKCKSCVKEYNKEYRLKNADKIKEKKRKYYILNKEKIDKINSDYYYKNIDKVKMKGKLYRDKNIDLLKDKNKNYYLNNKDIIIKKSENWRENNLTERKKYEKEYYCLNKKNKKEYNKNYYLNNKDIIIKKSKEYSLNNKEKLNSAKRKRITIRYKTDPVFQIKQSLRRRFRNLIEKGFIDYTGSKTKRSIELLGCDLDFFKNYIENLFTEGMSFENHGNKGWHYDHKRPLSSFNLLNEEEQIKAFHYTNIQPLWAIDNLRKGNKYG